MSKKLTRSQAINAFCKSCIYDPYGGNGSWVNQVEGCTATDCALYEHRPLTSATRGVLQEERFNAMDAEEKAQYLARNKETGERLAKTRNAGLSEESSTPSFL